MKHRLAVFGAAKFVYESIQKEINFTNSDVIAFVDNDPRKFGLIYEGIPIISPQELRKQEFDFVIVGAWFSYSEITKQLSSLGISKECIMPLYGKSLVRFLTSSIEISKNHFIFEIFKDGQKILQEIEKNNNMIERYANATSLDLVRKGGYTDMNNYPLIAHACGGIIGGTKKEYTNSLESFTEALENGYNMFECDLWGVQDGLLLLGSRLKMQYTIEIDYTILSLNVLLDKISNNLCNKVVVDIKWNTMEDFYRLLMKIEKLVSSFETKGFIQIREQIIIQTFDENSTRYAVKKGWECILTDYRNPEGAWMMKTAVICCENKISMVLMDAKVCLENPKYVHLLIDKNIDVVCYTVDEIEDYVGLKNLGIKSVLTNFLRLNANI